MRFSSVCMGLNIVWVSDIVHPHEPNVSFPDGYYKIRLDRIPFQM